MEREKELSKLQAMYDEREALVAENAKRMKSLGLTTNSSDRVVPKPKKKVMTNF